MMLSSDLTAYNSEVTNNHDKQEIGGGGGRSIQAPTDTAI